MMTKLVKLEKNYRNKQAKMSENTEDTMAQEEMLDKIAKLHHDSIHLKDLNASLMEWLDAAETENVSLCSDNKSLRKKANMLEKMVSEAQQDRGEPCPPSLADEKRKNVQKIQLMEEQLTLQREDNQQLISELKDLQQQRDEDKKTLSKISQAHQILQRDLEAAHLELQQNDMSIQEKNQLLRNAEKDLEEFFNTIEDLRRTNQELKFQLQERQDESSLWPLERAVSRDCVGFIFLPLGSRKQRMLRCWWTPGISLQTFNSNITVLADACKGSHASRGK
ncbi:immunoglobulin G-binding protein H-like isoform X4 [Takifugu flavidus]|uniref:immunoglobulin G-binding protein H-like isoform X4 n=1 Tax=Takifugu flavidus TaxID=433684 RepID=UPI00254465DC|nr:immunoglobulin G-binding protein H-like isoform X4 [Takifugu flavidus]